MTDASQSQLNAFVKNVDEFLREFNRLDSTETRQRVYATGDASLIDDYETAVSRGQLLKSNIENVTGAWNAAKQAYSDITGQTSMAIGDAIDAIRGWFGYEAVPGIGNLQGLGAVQIPAAAWVIGTSAAALALVGTIRQIFIRIEASELQRQNPGLSRADAIERAKDSVAILPSINWPVFAIGAAALVYLWSRR